MLIKRLDYCVFSDKDSLDSSVKKSNNKKKLRHAVDLITSLKTKKNLIRNVYFKDVNSV